MAEAAELREEEKIPEGVKAEWEEAERRKAGKRRATGLNYDLEDGEEDDLYAPGPSTKKPRAS